MAISDTSISSVELVNTFEQWRTKTNQVITVLNEQSDSDPASNLISANSSGGLSINTITSNIVTGSNVTGSKLLFSGGTVDFTGATVDDLGNVAKFALSEGVGATVSGASPDSKVERAQINECEINLNGKNFNANGASTITLTGATVADLGTVSLLTINGGTINNTNVSITRTDNIIEVSSPGPHPLTGATFGNGTFSNSVQTGGLTHSANISVNTNSVLVSNSGMAFGTDVGTANIAIGNFPEVTSPTLPTSSKGRVHIRTAFANQGTSATATEVTADELVLEGNSSVGMTMLANNTANATIAFGDPDDIDVGKIVYNHANNELHLISDTADALVIGNEFGGFAQIPGGDTYSGSGAQAGKLHINVGSSDATTGLFIDSNEVDERAVLIDGEQTTANIFQIVADTFTTGHVVSLSQGLGTGTSQACNGSLLYLTDNNSSTNARSIIDVIQDAAGATGSIGLKITTDGGIGLNINQNANNFGINVHSTNAHAEVLGLFVSNNTGSTGVTLQAIGKSSTGATKVLNIQNSSGDMMSSLANGSITFHNQAILAANASTNVNCRLAVLDTSGTVLNQT